MTQATRRSGLTLDRSCETQTPQPARPRAHETPSGQSRPTLRTLNASTSRSTTSARTRTSLYACASLHGSPASPRSTFIACFRRWWARRPQTSHYDCGLKRPSAPWPLTRDRHSRPSPSPADSAHLQTSPAHSNAATVFHLERLMWMHGEPRTGRISGSARMVLRVQSAWRSCRRLTIRTHSESVCANSRRERWPTSASRSRIKVTVSFERSHGS